MEINEARLLITQRKHRGVAGILAGVFLFAAIFTTGFGLILFVNSSTSNANQANIQRQNAELQSTSEKLMVTATITPLTYLGCPQCLVLKATNTGGSPSTIIDLYVTCQSNCPAAKSGDLVSDSVASPPSHFLRQSPIDLNVSLPFTLNVGASTYNGIQVNTPAFKYSSGEAFVASLLTSDGNVFSAQFPSPPLANTTYANIGENDTEVVLQQIAGGPQLSVSLTASALCPDGSPGCTQTFTCNNGCVTVTATVYNLAPSSATGVSVVLGPPSEGGTATVAPYPPGSGCVFPGGMTSATILPGGQAAATCQFSANTGQTGGLVSFSGTASGDIGFPVTSAEALSNSIEVGGLASVTTQGAFVTNFFFLEYSSCYQNTGGNFNSSGGCSTNASPVSLGNLPSAGLIAAGSNFYVAFYVQVTNLINTPLTILPNSYTYGDSSISGETFFFLVGNSSRLTNGVYYPTYSATPALVKYPSNCGSGCIVVNQSQTVILTFAACGSGSANWAWGGQQDAKAFDKSAGCTSNPPALTAPEAMPLGIVLSYVFNGQTHSQLMPFQGQQYIRSSSTSVSCAPLAVSAGTPTTCTASVLDTDGFPKAAPPLGTVTFSGQASTLGTFSSNSCTLSFGSCSVTYTPYISTQGAVTVKASYAGDTIHEASTNSTTITALDPTTTTVSGPCKGASVHVNTQTTCTVTVTDKTGGVISTPSGTVTMKDSPAGSGTFGSCTLTQVVIGTASCTVAYTPSSGSEGGITITATYNGDSSHGSSSGSTGLTAVQRTSSISVSCSPPSVPVSAPTTCTATVTDIDSGTRITPTGGIVTFSASPSSSGSFSPVSKQCTTSSGTCTVTFTPANGKAGTTASITATYAGDMDHVGSGPSAGFTVTITQITTAIAIACSPNPDGVNAPTNCTATVSDTGGATETPTGTVTFSASPSADGSFGSTTCTLSAGACSVTFTPNTMTSITVTGNYGGDGDHISKSGSASLTVSKRISGTSISCTPSPVVVNQATTCRATVTDTSGGTGATPTGTVTFSDSPTGSGNFGSLTCTLSAGSCSVTYTPTHGHAGTITMTGSFGGDSLHSPSSGSTPLTANQRSVTVTVTGCSPNPVTHGTSATCTVQVTDSSTGTAITPTGTVTFSLTWSHSDYSPSFANPTCTLSAAGTCSVTLNTVSRNNANAQGTATITATYNGDTDHVTVASNPYSEVVS